VNERLAKRLGLRRVSIFEDGVCVGQGELSLQGAVLECGAPLSDDVFDAVEDAIEEGKDCINVDGHEYTWQFP